MSDTNFDRVNTKVLLINGEEVVSVEKQADVVAPLTEAAGAIGGVNNSDIPSLTATVGADIAAFTAPPTAPEMALLRTFVNALKADVDVLRAATRENAAKTNAILTALKASELMASA